MRQFDFIRRYRTWGIGLIALGCLVYAAIFSFGVDVRELLDYLLWSVLSLVVLIFAAGLTVLVVKRASRLFGRDD